VLMHSSASPQGTQSSMQADTVELLNEVLVGDEGVVRLGAGLQLGFSGCSILEAARRKQAGGPDLLDRK